MSITYALYNIKAGHNTKMKRIQSISNMLKNEIKYIDISAIPDYRMFFDALNSDDDIVICGGDGTLNMFVNDTYNIEYPNEVYYYPCGTGNDFAADMGCGKGCMPFKITKYLKDLPTVSVNGMTRRFINGIGFGLDGYCCEEGDRLKKKLRCIKINYTLIALKGLLFGYKPTNATVVVDGELHAYRKVWIAPTMKGRFYGGGVMPTPNQDRSDPQKKALAYGLSRTWQTRHTVCFSDCFKRHSYKIYKVGRYSDRAQYNCRI